MKNAIISVVFTLLVVGGVRLAYTGAQYQYAEHKVNNGETYQAPKDFLSEVVEGCVDSPQGTEANRPYCVCAANHIQTSVGEVRFQAIALEYAKTKQMPVEMEDAVNACIDRYVQVETN